MKNSNFLDQMKCIIRNCDAIDKETEIREEDTQAEITAEEFHLFGIDDVFAN